MADLADQHESLKVEGARLITVSTDTKFVHLAWHREEKSLEKADFTMASDPSGEVSRIFEVYDETTGLALRGTFLISPEGLLLASEVNYYNVGRNSEELLRKLRANVYLAKHGESACPARWKKEGDKTLTPSADLVGRVHDALS